MADLNALIAQGAQFRQAPDPFVQYGQMQQLEQGRQTNELNQMKMQEAQATMAERNALRQLNPSAADYESQLFKVNPTLGIAYRKEASAAGASKAAQQLSEAKTAETKQQILGQAYRDLSNRPDDEHIVTYGRDVQGSTLFSDAEKATVAARVTQLLKMPVEERKDLLASQGAKSSELNRPPVILSPGQIAIPGNDPRLTGTGVTAPAAAAAAVKPPDKITIMTALGYPLTPEGDATYEAAKRAAPTVSAPPAAIGEMRALGIPETPAGFSYYNELKTKTPVAAPEPTTNEIKNAKAIALGAGPEGSTAYNQSLQTQLLRLTAKNEPVAAPPADSTEMKNAAAFARLKGEPGTPAYNKEFAAQMARLTAKSGGGEGGGGAGGAAGTGTVEVVDPKNPTRTIVVTKARAVAEGLTPAKAIEGLTPQMRQKLEASYPQATSSLKSHQNKSTMFIRDLKALRDSPGLDEVTGFAAGRAPGLTDAGRAAVALYDKVVAKGGFQAMQDLRDASKTGGALGNQSNMEGKQLIASFAAIDRKQNAKDVRKAIDDAIDDINSSNTRLQDAYDLTYEYKRGTIAPAAGGVDANNPLLK